MRIECTCGFQGSIREQDAGPPFGIIARCFGCDRIYDTKGNVVAGVPKDIPNMTYEEMQKLLDKTNAGKSPTGKKRPSRKRKPAEKDASTKLQASSPPVAVYKTIHFYLRPTDNWTELLKDGRQEADMSGSGTLVFVHQHGHGEECKDTCREVV